MAFWYPNGIEEVYNNVIGTIVPSNYGLSAKILHEGKECFVPVLASADIKEGGLFTSFKAMQLRKYCYDRGDNGELIKVPAKDRGDGEVLTVWRVSEVYK